METLDNNDNNFIDLSLEIPTPYETIDLTERGIPIESSWDQYNNEQSVFNDFNLASPINTTLSLNNFKFPQLSNTQSFKCAICNNDFQNKQLFISHVQSHASETATNSTDTLNLNNIESESYPKLSTGTVSTSLNSGNLNSTHESLGPLQNYINNFQPNEYDPNVSIKNEYDFPEEDIVSLISEESLETYCSDDDTKIVGQTDLESLLNLSELSASQSSSMNQIESFCSYCNIQLESKPSLLQHLKSFHKTKVPKMYEGSSIKPNNHQNTSMKKQDNVSVHSCALCEGAFIGSQELLLHMRKDHPSVGSDNLCSDNKMFYCHICKLSYSFESKFLQHINKHEQGDTSLQIQLISSTTDTDQYRNQDIKYECRKCGVTFGNNEEMVVHIEDIHLEDNFCFRCNFTFPYRSDFEHHLMIHEHSRDITCGICSSIFPNVTCLRRHFKELHSQFQVSIKQTEEEESLFLTCRLCFHKASCKEEIKEHLLFHDKFYRNLIWNTENNIQSNSFFAEDKLLLKSSQLNLNQKSSSSEIACVFCECKINKKTLDVHIENHIRSLRLTNQNVMYVKQSNIKEICSKNVDEQKKSKRKSNMNFQKHFKLKIKLHNYENSVHYRNYPGIEIDTKEEPYYKSLLFQPRVRINRCFRIKICESQLELLKEIGCKRSYDEDNGLRAGIKKMKMDKYQEDTMQINNNTLQYGGERVGFDNIKYPDDIAFLMSQILENNNPLIHLQDTEEEKEEGMKTNIHYLVYKDTNNDNNNNEQILLNSTGSSEKSVFEMTNEWIANNDWITSNESKAASFESSYLGNISSIKNSNEDTISTANNSTTLIDFYIKQEDNNKSASIESESNVSEEKSFLKLKTDETAVSVGTKQIESDIGTTEVRRSKRARLPSRKMLDIRSDQHTVQCRKPSFIFEHGATAGGVTSLEATIFEAIRNALNDVPTKANVLQVAENHKVVTPTNDSVFCPTNIDETNLAQESIESKNVIQKNVDDVFLTKSESSTIATATNVDENNLVQQSIESENVIQKDVDDVFLTKSGSSTIATSTNVDETILAQEIIESENVIQKDVDDVFPTKSESSTIATSTNVDETILAQKSIESENIIQKHIYDDVVTEWECRRKCTVVVQPLTFSNMLWVKSSLAKGRMLSKAVMNIYLNRFLLKKENKANIKKRKSIERNCKKFSTSNYVDQFNMKWDDATVRDKSLRRTSNSSTQNKGRVTINQERKSSNQNNISTYNAAMRTKREYIKRSERNSNSNKNSSTKSLKKVTKNQTNSSTYNAAMQTKCKYAKRSEKLACNNENKRTKRSEKVTQNPTNSSTYNAVIRTKRKYTKGSEKLSSDKNKSTAFNTTKLGKKRKYVNTPEKLANSSQDRIQAKRKYTKRKSLDNLIKVESRSLPPRRIKSTYKNSTLHSPLILKEDSAMPSTLPCKNISHQKSSLVTGRDGRLNLTKTFKKRKSLQVDQLFSSQVIKNEKRKMSPLKEFSQKNIVKVSPVKTKFDSFTVLNK